MDGLDPILLRCDNLNGVREIVIFVTKKTTIAGAKFALALCFVLAALHSVPARANADSADRKLSRASSELRSHSSEFARSIRQAIQEIGITGVTVSAADVRAAIDRTTIVTVDGLLADSQGHDSCGAGGCSAVTMPNGDGTFGIGFDTEVIDSNPYDPVGGLVAHEMVHVILEAKGLSAERQHAVTCAMGLGGGVHHGHTGNDCSSRRPRTEITDASTVERPAIEVSAPALPSGKVRAPEAR